MVSISDRLGRIGKFPWATAWTTVATLLGGAVAGGLLALIPFLSTAPAPSATWKHIYIAALLVVGLLCVFATAAAITTHKERSESIADIKADYDKGILDTYEWESGAEGQRASAGEGARQLREDRQVGVASDPIQPTDSEWK